jgi:hypothetical protein
MSTPEFTRPLAVASGHQIWRMPALGETLGCALPHLGLGDRLLLRAVALLARYHILSPREGGRLRADGRGGGLPAIKGAEAASNSRRCLGRSTMDKREPVDVPFLIFVIIVTIFLVALGVAIYPR